MSRRAQEAERNAQGEGDLNQYDTNPVAVLALMGVEPLPERIWEPAAGAGNIVVTLREQGRLVTASDIAPRFPGHYVDFMQPLPKRFPKPDVQAIVTNPPFNLLRDGWVERCLSFCPDVYLLARLQFLEGSSAWRHQVLEKSGLRRIYVFRDRLPMMHKKEHLEAGGKLSTSRMAFAWFCWRRGWSGLTSVKRISWKAPGPPLPPKGVALPKTYCRQTLDMFPTKEMA